MATYVAAPVLPGAALAFRRILTRRQTAARLARAGGSVLLLVGGQVGGVLAGILAGAPATAAAQLPPAAAPQKLRFRHLGVDDGLPSSMVTSVRQDRRGFLWLGTSRGVSRYDGHHFRTYDHRPGDRNTLPSDVVTQVYVDRSDVVWAVTPRGLSRYDATLDRFVTVVTGGASPAAAGRRATTGTVTSVVEDAAGTLWVGTSVGLHRLNRITGETTPFPIAAPRGDPINVTSLYEDRTGGLWVGATGAVYRLGPTRSTAPRYYPLSPEETRVTDATEDSAGNVWIATEGAGLLQFAARSGTLHQFRHDVGDPYSLGRDRIMALVADRRGGMWVGTENSGLDYADPVTGRFIHHRFDPNTPSSISSNSVQSLYLDATGALWVGTFSGGLDVSPLTASAIESFGSVPGDASSLSYNTVPKFAEGAGGQIWVATDGGGLNRFDPATGRFVRYTQQTTNLNTGGVVGVVEGRRGDVWIGTWGGGLSELDQERRVFTAYTTKNSTLPNDNVTEVVEDRAGRLWLGMDRAMVAVFDRTTRTVTHRYHVAAPGADPVSPVWLVLELADGSMAIGLEDGGLTILNPATGVQSHYIARADDGTPAPANVRGTISGTDVRTLFEETPGMLWVGTNNGLDRLDLRFGNVVHYGEADGLPSRFIDGVLPDGLGRLWVSTDRGLARLDPRTRAVKLYGRPDGLQGNEFVKRAALRARDGTLYFGGNHGFNKVRPAELVENTRPPSVVVTELQLFNKPARVGAADSPLRRTIDRTDTLVVDHTQNVIGFEFAALDFSAPERNQYAYRLDGFDREWQEVGTQYTASYTNLAPGQYTLWVKASNGDGVWTKGASTLVLVIRPPVWQTWWFRALAGALAACALFALWRFQQLRRLEVALGRQALQDGLTGLANRALFHDRVQHALTRLARAAASEDRRVGVLFLDLDGFKAVNDAMGHRAGDRLLQGVAARLLNATRGCDTVARFGGDEFAVLVENARGLLDANTVADRILSALRTPIEVGGGSDGGATRDARVGASIGIALAEPGVNADTLLAQADAAMYQAKSEGKGRQVVFHPALVAAQAEQLALEMDLALALDRREFALVYQPIVAVESGIVESVEALLRWHHPTRGIVSPVKFIPLAEASGLIVDLGCWVLEEACRTAAGWPPGPTGARIGITVNVSGRQLDDPLLPTYVATALTASGLPASRLTLEITESVLMRNTDATLTALGALKDLGLQLAIDDFGTGYSSLRYLQQFPVDVLKIDKSFVDGVARGGRDAALGRTIVALAETLGLRTVAEGIEDSVQRELLGAMGCELGQGYLFARPLDAAAMHALLARGQCLGQPNEIGLQPAA
jgi:diguanylate cyclase (GGDEF)-like protein